MTRFWKQVLLITIAFLCCYIPDASALTIITRPVGGAAPGNAVGGGNLTDIVNAAAHIWESAYSDRIVITLYYGWAEVGDAGIHTLVQSDQLDREISGTILFDNSGSVSFYLDPTPNYSEEYQRKREEYQDLGSDLVNVARVFSSPVAEAVGHVDLLSVALHEIGHALGLSTANARFLSQSTERVISISEAYPFAGTIVPLAFNDSGTVPHFDTEEVVYGSLMSGINADERRMPSELDVLAIAQVSGFTILSLSPFEQSTLRRGSTGMAGRSRMAERAISSTSGFKPLR